LQFVEFKLKGRIAMATKKKATKKAAKKTSKKK